MLKLRYFWLPLILTAWSPTYGPDGQNSTADESISASASAAYDAKDWENAAKLYGELSRSAEVCGCGWVRLSASSADTAKRWQRLKKPMPLERRSSGNMERPRFTPP